MREINRQGLNTNQYIKAMSLAGMRAWTSMGMSMMVPDTRFTALPDPKPYLSGQPSPVRGSSYTPGRSKKRRSPPWHSASYCSAGR